MDLGADVVRDEAHDALSVSRGQPFTRIGESLGQPIHPEATVRVQHDLDDGGVFEQMCDGCAERGAEHARTARERLRLLAGSGHFCPAFSRG